MPLWYGKYDLKSSMIYHLDKNKYNIKSKNQKLNKNKDFLSYLFYLF